MLGMRKGRRYPHVTKRRKKEQSSEKVMTRYDKKVQKRKEEAERAKKQAKTEK